MVLVYVLAAAHRLLHSEATKPGGDNGVNDCGFRIVECGFKKEQSAI
jgi:hypothetical protein